MRADSYPRLPRVALLGLYTSGCDHPVDVLYNCGRGIWEALDLIALLGEHVSLAIPWTDSLLAILAGGRGTEPSHDWWVQSYMEDVRRCDGAIALAGWEGSGGAVAEVEECERVGIPVMALSGDVTECAHSIREFVLGLELRHGRR